MINESILKDSYLNQKKSIDTISKEIGYSRKKTRAILEKLGIRLRSRKESSLIRGSIYRQLNDSEWLKKQYIELKKNQSDIAKEVGCCVDAVTLSLRKFNIHKSATQIKLDRYSSKPAKSSFYQLNDPEWLRENAIVKKMTYQSIADICGCNLNSVIRVLKKYKIYEKRRSYDRIVGKSSYEALNDKAFLEKLYLIENKSSVEIAEKIGCSNASVTQSLRRLGINVRTQSEGQRLFHGFGGIKFNKKTLAIINGGLLGDASLVKSNKGSNASYKKTSIHKEYLEYELNILSGGMADPKQFIRRIKTSGFVTFRGKTYKTQKIYVLSSHVYPKLTLMHNKWYDKKAKVIPKNIFLSKETLLHWFLDDGYSYVVNRKYKDKKWNHQEIRIYLCTQSFQLEELELICKKIKKTFNLTFFPRFHKRKYSNGSGYELELSIKDIEKFYDVIGDCPVKCFQYKWKRFGGATFLKNKWEKRFLELRTFIEEHKFLPQFYVTRKDNYSPSKFEKSLADWVSNQRSRAKNGKITKHEKDRLNELSIKII